MFVNLLHVSQYWSPISFLDMKLAQWNHIIPPNHVSMPQWEFTNSMVEKLHPMKIN